MGNDPRYPIGRFQAPSLITPEIREGWLEALAQTPARLRAAVEGLSQAQLDTPYREGGWTVRQVVHHLSDSHLNSYVRFKLALTEESPTIKPYDEQAWARLGDSRDTPIEVSLRLLEALHERWVVLLRGLKEEDWQRSFVHPESGPTILARALGLYAWHGSHHITHVTELRRRMGW